MDIIDNNSNDKDDANEEIVLKDDKKTNKKKVKIAKITRVVGDVLHMKSIL